MVHPTWKCSKKVSQKKGPHNQLSKVTGSFVNKWWRKGTRNKRKETNKTARPAREVLYIASSSSSRKQLSMLSSSNTSIFQHGYETSKTT